MALAAALIRGALDHPLNVPSKELPPNSDLLRAPLLEAQVEIEIAAGDIHRAQSAADELTRIAAVFESKAMAAAATLARGHVRLATPTAPARAANSKPRPINGPRLVRRTRPRSDEWDWRTHIVPRT